MKATTTIENVSIVSKCFIFASLIILFIGIAGKKYQNLQKSEEKDGKITI